MRTAKVFGRKKFFIALILFILGTVGYFLFAGRQILDVWILGPIYFWPYARLAAFFTGVGSAVIMFSLVLFDLFDAILKHTLFAYELEPDSIKIISGLIKKQESYIPYKNIQSVDIQVTGSEYVWGLADVLIFTSGVGDKRNPDSAEGFIEGLLYNNAVALKDELFRRMNARPAAPAPTAQPMQ